MKTRDRGVQRSLFVVSTLAAALLSLPALAAEGSVELGAGVPSVKEVEQGLFPDDVCEELKTAGFKCMGFKPPVRFVLPSTSFLVGSSALPDGLKRQLDVFAQVLKGKSGAARAVRIEGHADASGTPEGNEALSLRRAEAARDYLVSKGVSTDLLKPVGMGSKALAVGDQPMSPKNRRVEIGREQAPQSP